MRRLAIISTHPIQYNAPWFRMLAERKVIQIKVFYTWSQTQHEEKFDPGFGKVIQWDIPLLEGYDYTFVKNVAKNPGSKSFLGINNPTLIEEIRAWKPDSILVFGWKFKSHLAVIRYFKGRIPVLFRGDSTLLDDRGGIKQWLRNQVLRWVYKRIDYALYVGEENRRYFIKSGLTPEQLIFAPHAVDNTRFRISGDDFFFRKKLNIPGGNLVFLFAGKLEVKKSPIQLARTFKSIGKSNVHLLFVGNGHLEAELKEKYRQENIHFLDFQNQLDMPAVYKSCDVFVLPSVTETWGLAVNEAMACGKPVLVSDRCGCAIDLVKDGKNGYVFHSGDPTDLKQKMEWLIKDRQTLRKMGDYSQQKIQDWSFEKMATVIEETIKNIT